MITGRQKIEISSPAEDKRTNPLKIIVRKKYYLIAVLAILLVVFGVFFALKHYKKSITQLPQLPQLIIEETKENNLMEGKSAIALGLATAQKWQADAELSHVLSADPGQLTGRSNDWQLIYVSPSIKGKGFLVKIADAKVSDTAEVSYIGQAAKFPANVISQAEAVAQAKAIKGFADAKVLGIEMIYGAAVKTWYWGVRTDKGTVSVIAAKEK